MNSVVLAWYAWLSGLTEGPVLALQGWADHLQLPLVTAVLLGVMGATSPCQLTTNLSALAYASARPVRGRPFLVGVAYAAGKVSVYTLGPLMLVMGLGLLGFVTLKMTVGQRFAAGLHERLARRGLAQHTVDPSQSSLEGGRKRLTRL